MDLGTYLVGLAQHVDEIPGFIGIGVGEQRVRSSCIVRATSSTNPMNVIFGVWRVVVINYKLHVFDICSVAQRNGS